MKNATFLFLIIAALLTGFKLRTLMTKQKMDTMPETKKRTGNLTRSWFEKQKQPATMPGSEEILRV